MHRTFEEVENSLLPCPFCGGPARIEMTEFNHEGFRMVITCVRCGATVDHTKQAPRWYTGLEKYDAAELWNRRNKVEAITAQRTFSLMTTAQKCEIEKFAHRTMTRDIAQFMLDAGVIEFSEKVVKNDQLICCPDVEYTATVRVVVPEKEE